MTIKAKALTRALLFQRATLYALVDPTGLAVQLGTENICLSEFHKRRWPTRLVLGDEDLDHARHFIKTSGWQITRVRMGVFTEDVGDLRKLVGAA